MVGATRTTLPTLPLEILQHIADYVGVAHWPSLKAFSLTSKACHEASLIIILRRISIAVNSREGLRRDVDALVEALSRSDAFRHVKQMTIRGALRLRPKQEGWGPQRPWTTTSGLREILDEEPVSFSGMYSVYDESVIEASSEEDLAWGPLVDTLQTKEIPLKDLVYDCQSQLPPSLLRTLHETHPQCRLHHLTFKFRTLLWDEPFPYEMELATSPSLYKVKATCAPRDSDYDDDFNLEALMELASGLAPNLKEVVALNLCPAGSLKPSRPRAPWRGLPGFIPGRKGKLTSLSLKGFSKLRNPAMLQDWARHVDFACFQHLALGGCADAKTIGLSGETMEWLTNTKSFPQVRRLHVHLTRDDHFVERLNYSSQAVLFFRNFEPLKELSIDGPIDADIVDSVLSHHGHALRKLHLFPFEDKSNFSNARDERHIPFQFTKNRILQIEAQCPMLEELAVPVKRNKSSASEAEVYRCFGRFRHLQYLFLILICSNTRAVRDDSYVPVFDNEEDREPIEERRFPILQRGDLKETFINCAVDETLARSIWRIMNENKKGRRLERLKLWTLGDDEFNTGPQVLATFPQITQNMTRSWLFERRPQGDRDDDFTVRELRREVREARSERHAQYLTYARHPGMMETFRSIWPPKQGSRDWRDDWCSFPLQEE